MIYTLTLNTALDCLISRENYELDKSLAMEVPAGKGINVSRALASKGIATVCLGIVGLNDKEKFETVSSELIKTDFIFVPGNTRKNLTITGFNDGIERHERNEGFSVTDEDIEKIISILDERIKENDYLVMSGSLPQGAHINTYRKMIEHFNKKGVITIVDTSGPALKEAVLAAPFVIKPNLDELISLMNSTIINELSDNAIMKELSASTKDGEDSYLTDSTHLDPANESHHGLIEDSIKKISSSYSIENILATFDLNGATAYNLIDDISVDVPVYTGNVDKPFVSTVGCGDCSLAGFIYGLINELTLKECADCAMKFAFENLYAKMPGALE